MIVADCTVIARLIVRIDDPQEADALVARDSVWAVPGLWQAEFASVLRKYERVGRLTAELSADCVEQALRLLAQTTYQVPISRILEVSRQTGCSTYDSHYLALAETLRVPVYTYDEKLVARCPRLARRPE